MKVHRVVGFALAAFLLVGLLPLPTAVAIGIDDPHLRLGKIDPGHQSTHLRDVTNTGTSAITVDVRAICPCPVYVTVTPDRFELAPGAKKTLEIKVDVPADADPGAHDTQIQVTERSQGGSGGTAVASATISAFFQVRTATLFLNPPTGDDSIPVRFVNAHEETLDVTIQGTLEGLGVSRTIEPTTVSAPGSGPGARVTTLMVPLPFQPTDPKGGYAATLWATWTNETTGTTGSSGPHHIDVAHGSALILQHFEARTAPNGLQMAATMRSLAPGPIDAWLSVTLTPVDGGPSTTIESDPITLDAFGTDDLTFDWRPDRSGVHTVQAQALYITKDGAKGSSSDWPLTQVELHQTAADPGQSSSMETTPDDGQTPASGPAGSTTLMGIVALAGLGVGATVAILVNRRGRT